MPVFTIETPSGKRLKIEAPDEATAMQGAQDFEEGRAQVEPPAAPQAAPPAAPQGPAGVTGIGLLDAGITGVRQGLEGMGGMFGDANQMQGDLAGWAVGKFGASPETQATASKFGRRLSMIPMAPTTEEIRTNLTKPVAGENYEPRTIGEEYMRTGGQFAPAALAGPGSLARRVAMTAVPALASETAGQVAREQAPEYEPIARGIGALVGGVASAGKFNPKATKPQATVDDILAAGSAAFKRAEAEGVMFNQAGVARLRKNIFNDLIKASYRPKNEPGVVSVVDDLQRLTKSKSNMTLEGLNSLRTLAQNGWIAGNKSNNAAIGKIVERIDELVDAADPATLIMGRNPKAAAAALKEGRAQWHAGRKLETVEKYINRGEAMANAQVNADTAGVTKRQLKNLMLNEGKTRGFKPAEMKQLKTAAGYTPAQRVLHAASGLLPRDKLSTGIHAVGALASSGASLPLQAAGWGVGFAAQKAAAALSRKSVDELTSLIASGGVPAPVTKSVLQLLAKSKREALVRSLLAAESGKNSALANAPLR